MWLKISQRRYFLSSCVHALLRGFAKQSESFQESIIPKEAHKVAIEAGSSDLWYRWVGHEGQIFALDDYGHSAPAQDVYRVMGLTVESICSKVTTMF